jgi:hypothetical protein
MVRVMMISWAYHWPPLSSVGLYFLATQLDFNFAAIHQILIIWWLQFRKVTGNELFKDTPKVPE